MGSEISSLVIEPLMGMAVVALCITAIERQNSGDVTTARWETITAIVLTALIIILSIIFSMMG